MTKGFCTIRGLYASPCKDLGAKSLSELLDFSVAGAKSAAQYEEKKKRSAEKKKIWRRARDSNPHALSYAGFQDRCNSHSASSPHFELDWLFQTSANPTTSFPGFQSIILNFLAELNGLIREINRIRQYSIVGVCDLACGEMIIRLKKKEE